MTNKAELNKDIESFEQVSPITEDMKLDREGISRMVMLDRYSFKDLELKTLGEGDTVILTVKDDPKYPARGIGEVVKIEEDSVYVKIEDEYSAQIEEDDRVEEGKNIVKRLKSEIDKPMELYYEQIAERVARGLTEVEEEEVREKVRQESEEILKNERLIPAGRVLYGAGSGADVTYFNCYIHPFIEDSREGLAKHRGEVMNIMSRGGGVGTNGSTLRPRNALARGVNGKSSGSVLWLNDLSSLTNLVQQGGSRRGAQMLILADWHPDIIEFIISKMQNPNILKYIVENFEDEEIKQLAKDKLKFKPMASSEKEMYQSIVDNPDSHKYKIVKEAEVKLKEGGTWDVENPDMLTGANISVALTNDFMDAVKEDKEWSLRFPDTESYNEEEMNYYNTEWSKVGDVRKWENEHNMGVKTYRTIPAKDLWKLINFCATYSAEPGIFFIDRANEMAMSNTYGQSVVATNPCFTGDMKLLTDEGYKTFEELAETGEANVVNENGDISYNSPVWSSGVKDIVKVRLSNHDIVKSTPDHRYKTNTGETVEAKDLVGHQLMPFLEGKRGLGFLDTDYLAMGFIQGDGSTQDLKKMNQITVNLGKDDGDVKDFFKDNYKYSINKNNRVWTVAGLNDKMKQLGVKSTALLDRDLPTTYKEWSLENKRSFLVGLYSANGSVLKKYGRVTFKSINRTLIEELKDTLLNDFGIQAYVTTNKSKKVNFHNGTYQCRESYDLNIGKYNEKVKFYNELGFIHEYKNNRLKNHLIEKAPKVVSVTETGETEKVYDFTESVTHWGVVEGYVVHNCGEQPLPGNSVCNLSAVNLAQHVDKEAGEVDYGLLKDTVRKAVRLQDNVIDSTYYFFEPNTIQAKSERRIGLGVMGLADMLIYAGEVYGSKEGNKLVDKVFETMATTAWETSVELAKEKGSFPYLVGETDEETQKLREKFVNTGYIKERMSDSIKESILEHGVRNVALLTVAPTGSTGTMVGTSTGLEPYFAFKYFRSGRLGKFIEVNADIVQEYLDKNPEANENNLPEYFISSMELTPEAHADVQNTIQYWVDSSISKTVNMPKGSTPSDVAEIYQRLYEGGAKGGTVYVDGSRDSQVLTLDDKENEMDAKAHEEEPEVVEDPEELKRLVNTAEKEHKTTYGDTDDVVYGSEVGDTCPVCRKGSVADIGGCNTCTNCNAQLKCGL